MILEISVGIIALAFVLLVVFLIITLCRSCTTLKKATHTLTKFEHDFNDLSSESVKLIKHLNELTVDIKKKSDALNFLFRPLFKMNHPKAEERSHLEGNYEKISEAMNYLAEGVLLFKKIKDGGE